MNGQIRGNILSLTAFAAWILLAYTLPGTNPASACQSKPISSQESRRENDEEILAVLGEALKENKTVPGMVAAIVRDGKPIRIAAVGVRKSDSEAPITPDDVMHLGSCTKAITATAIGRLIDQGKIQLDWTIKKTLPELSEEIHEDYASVTLHQLLQHRSGMPANALGWWLQGGDDLAERRHLIAVASLKKKPLHEPGTKFLYSNLGYMVAGMMAAKAAGMGWEDLMRKEVFETLNLESAGFGVPGTKGQTDQPWGHRLIEGELKPVQFDNSPALGPAGTIHMNLSDWGKFASKHLNEKDNGYLTNETMRMLHDPGSGRKYALGWGVHPRPWADGNALSHSGSNTMWYCVAWVAPEKRVAYLVATNVMGKDIPKIVDGVASQLIRMDKE